MGDIINGLAKIPLNGAAIDCLSIELNQGDTEDIVHIQTPAFRIELTRDEFLEFAAAMLKAERKLLRAKRPR